MKRLYYLMFVVTLVLWHGLGLSPVAAETPYYQGKTIEILVESRVGGGTDTWARVTAGNLPNFIPGKPKIVVRTMPGAAGVVANNLFYLKGKPDGLHLLQNSTSPVSMQQRSRGIVKYNLLEYKHIGHISRGGNIVMISTQALPRLTDPKAKPVIVGTKEGEETWQAVAMWGREFLGWNVRWVPGYQGTSDMELAFRRGENEFIASSTNVVLNRLIKEAKAVPLTQMGFQKKGQWLRRKDYPDVPTFVETLGDKKPTGEPWQAYIAWAGVNELGKLLCAPPGTPDAYLSILRNAYAGMAKDPKFDKLVKKMVATEYDISIGDETGELLKQVLDVPQSVLDYAVELQRKFGIIVK